MRRSVALCVITIAIFGWQISPGGLWEDRAYGVCPTSDGGLLVSGISENPSAYWFDAMFLKVSITGDVEWETFVGNEWYQDGGNAAVEVSDGYLLIGWTESFGAIGKDIFIRKVSYDGDSLWQKRYGTYSADMPTAVCATSDGNFMIAAESHGFSAEGDADVYLLKINEEGDTLWTAFYGDSPRNEVAHDIITTSDGHFLLAGKTWGGESADSNMLAMKIADDGSEFWSETFGGSYDDAGWGCCELTTGEYCIAGVISLIPAHADIWTIYLNSDGDSLNTSIFSTAGHDIAHSVVATDDGNMVMAGWMSYNAFIMKFSMEGVEIWRNLIGGVRDDRFMKLVKRGDGLGYFAAGETKSYGDGTPTEFNYYIVSTNEEGDPGADCFPAFVWSPEPFPDSSHVACLDVNIGFSISDPFLRPIDDERLWFTRFVEHLDGTIDTTFFDDPSDMMTFDVAGTLKVLFIGDYDVDDVVTIFADSCYNVDDCMSFLNYSNTVMFDPDLPVLSDISPAPFSEVEFDGVEDIVISITVDDAGTGVNEEELSIVWAKWQRILGIWSWRDTVYSEYEVAIPPAGYAVGDSIKICMHVSDMTVASGACPANAIDSCWTYRLIEAGTGVTHSYSMKYGWNLIASPFAASINIASSFPAMVDSPYRWSNIAAAYDAIADVSAGTAFWLLYPDSATVDVSAIGFSSGLTWILEAGWNMVGTDGAPVSIDFSEYPLIQPPIYFFEDGVYDSTSTMLPGKGYWILTRGRVEIDI